MMKAIFDSGNPDLLRGPSKTASFYNTEGSYEGTKVKGIHIEPEGARSIDLFYHDGAWHLGYLEIDKMREVVELVPAP